MKIIRRINNNAAVAQDKRGREMVVLGRGVGFGQLPYELTDMSVVYRTFYDVDPKYFDVCWQPSAGCGPASADIIEQAEISLGCDLNPNLPFTLADHIAFAIKREQQGIRLAMPLAFDVKHLYPQEYELGAAGAGNCSPAYQRISAESRGQQHRSAYCQRGAGKRRPAHNAYRVGCVGRNHCHCRAKAPHQP